MILRTLTIAIAAVTVCGAAAPAFAQQTPPPSPPPLSRTPMELARHMSHIRHAQQAQARGHNLGPQSLERIDLANRVSTFIDLGRCAEARAMAAEAGERVMALRVRQLCRPGRVRAAPAD